MKPLPFVFSKQAVQDLEEIWLYTVDKWSVEQADRYYLLIIEEVNYICKNIHSGKSFEEIRSGYRASKVKSHLIFYRIVNNTVEIIRILHERMDLKNHISG